MNMMLEKAAMDFIPPAQNDPPLTLEQKQQWNNFVDYLEKVGYKGSSLLDDRDKGMGAKLIQQYKQVNPQFNLNYDNVKNVQQDLTDYRDSLVKSYKSGKAVVDGVKSEKDIMPNISPVDGWLGSKTSSWKFPGARLTETTPTGTTVKDFGLDVNAYDAAMMKMKH